MMAEWIVDLVVSAWILVVGGMGLLVLVHLAKRLYRWLKTLEPVL